MTGGTKGSLMNAQNKALAGPPVGGRLVASCKTCKDEGYTPALQDGEFVWDTCPDCDQAYNFPTYQSRNANEHP